MKVKRIESRNSSRVTRNRRT
ncbi:hypothetical protein E2C01_094475 [Portunus trituberculatus]|uniref:Uncharacterized protein n=1 Tax=Portunus trituberculatus TaxID=210409 RepID=A0A5B7JQI6_PORTR|nr:hypothetical protein [Portunus trituberculatus]